MANRFASIDLPPIPDKWVFKSGWYRYSPGLEPEKVPYPLENTLSFDVECLYKISPFPTLATCASEKAWYGWVSPYLTDEVKFPGNESLIPLNPQNEQKIILGHNVGYDRSKTIDEYFSFENSNGFYIDTIALYHARYSRIFNFNDTELQKAEEPLFEGNVCKKLFGKYTAFNFQLSVLYKTQFKEELDKAVRALFDSKSKNIIVEEFQDCMHYCAKDVFATHGLFTKFWIRFIQKLSHPLEFIAIKEMGNHKVTLDIDQWNKFIKNCERSLKTTTARISKNLKELGRVKKLGFVSLKTNNIAEALGVKFKGKPLVWDQNLNQFCVQNEDGTLHTLDPKGSLKTLFNKPQRILWDLGALKVDPSYQHIIDDFKSLNFWTFKNMDQDLHLVPIENEDKIITALPRIRVSSNSAGEPISAPWLITPAQGVIGADYRDQIVPPTGYVYVNLPIDETLVESAILGQEGLQYVSPRLQRDALNRTRVQYLYHMIIAAQYFFKSANITQFQLASTYSNEVRYLVKKEDEEKIREILNLVDRLVKLAIHAEIPRVHQDDTIEIQVDELISEEKPDKPELFGQFKNLLQTQIVIEKTRK